MIRRELKFRAWHPTRKQMLPVRSLHNIHSGVNVHADLCVDDADTKVISTHYSEGASQSDIIYMQYTGLDDRNGKGIYEGDICRVEYIKHSEPNLKLLQFVEYDAGCFFFKCKDADMSDYNHTYRWIEMYAKYKVEVVGNIYETPELLVEKEKQV